jgi:hypothetical protein
MVQILAVSDEIDEGLCADVRAVRGADLILACGDLPFDYLGYLMNALDVPLVFVPGNHDPDLTGYAASRAGLMLRAGLPVTAPWPSGAINVDGRVVEVLGLRVAGLGGCLRYSAGPNQYSEWQQARRARALSTRVRWQRLRGAPAVDILLTHAPPYGVGDGDDPPHRGFRTLHGLAARLRVPLLLHGHVHPYGAETPDASVGGTTVRNVVGRHVFGIDSTPAGREVYTDSRGPNRLSES